MRVIISSHGSAVMTCGIVLYTISLKDDNNKKKLNKMRTNPRDWRIEQLETIASHYGVIIRKSGGSHVVFDHPSWIELLCIPAHRPIKAVYVKKLINLLDLLVPYETN